MRKNFYYLLSLILLSGSLNAQDHHWPLDEDYADIVGSKDGVAAGNCTFVEDSERGQVLELDGDNSYVNLPRDLFTDVSDVTITCWFYYEGTNIWERVYSFGYSNVTETENPTEVRTIYLVPRDNNGNLHVTYQAGGDWHDMVNSNEGDSIQYNQWYFSAFVKEGETIKFYLDDEVLPGMETSGVTEDPSALEDSANHIGKSHWLDATFDGKIDDLRIYKEALSESEIMDIFNEPAVGVENITASPKHYGIYSENGKIFIRNKTPNNQIVAIEVYDMQGKIVTQAKTQQELSRNTFSPGLYIVNVKGNQFSETVKIIMK